MATKLTDWFGGSLVLMIRDKLNENRPDIPADRLSDIIPRLEEQPLMERIRTIADQLNTIMPEDPGEALEVHRAIMGPPLRVDQQTFNDGYWMLPLAEFWSRCRLEYPDTVTRALEEWTQRGTAEFAVRSLIENFPEEMKPVLGNWVTHESFHVRRLASEGTRPYLPWGGRLKVDRAASLDYLRIISPLRDDSSSYVRRSVGNHVRDWRRIETAVADQWIGDMDPPEDVRKLALPRKK